ncbi:hypothetical protein [Aeromonas sp. QDB14]|uniref:hypothetical protein n=1 Tax=Aeromonas sp. QDB14 TaxID=2989836 RepID=UPI0022DF1802|nr:hypothetical protein [Aeromonas sp. QDB14]
MRSLSQNAVGYPLLLRVLVSLRFRVVEEYLREPEELLIPTALDPLALHIFLLALYEPSLQTNRSPSQ